MRALPSHSAALPAVGIGWRQPHYGALLQERAALDFVEVHSENFFAEGGAALAVLLQGRERYGVSLHGVGLSLGSAMGLDAWHLAQLRRLVQRVQPLRVSDHAAFARAPYRQGHAHAADLLPLPFSDEALRVLSRNVQQAQEALERPLLVENLSAYLHWRVPAGERAWQEADFLVELTRRSGCGLLVDLNNLLVNARNAQWGGWGGEPLAACMAWVDAVPAHCVGEIHLAGHCVVHDEEPPMAIDDHGSAVSDAVWRLYRHALRRWGPVPTLIEWDTDVPALAVLLQEAERARAHARQALQEGVPCA
ncbi:MAG: DUF692 domain-containing protein [Rhodoferax sp.]